MAINGQEIAFQLEGARLVGQGVDYKGGGVGGYQRRGHYTGWFFLERWRRGGRLWERERDPQCRKESLLFMGY